MVGRAEASPPPSTLQKQTNDRGGLSTSYRSCTSDCLASTGLDAAFALVQRPPPTNSPTGTAGLCVPTRQRTVPTPYTPPSAPYAYLRYASYIASTQASKPASTGRPVDASLSSFLMLASRRVHKCSQPPRRASFHLLDARALEAGRAPPTPHNTPSVDIRPGGRYERTTGPVTAPSAGGTISMSHVGGTEPPE